MPGLARALAVRRQIRRRVYTAHAVAVHDVTYPLGSDRREWYWVNGPKMQQLVVFGTGLGRQHEPHSVSLMVARARDAPVRESCYTANV